MPPQISASSELSSQDRAGPHVPIQSPQERVQGSGQRVHRRTGPYPDAPQPGPRRSLFHCPDLHLYPPGGSSLATRPALQPSLRSINSARWQVARGAALWGRQEAGSESTGHFLLRTEERCPIGTGFWTPRTWEAPWPLGRSTVPSPSSPTASVHSGEPKRMLSRDAVSIRLTEVSTALLPGGRVGNR